MKLELPNKKHKKSYENLITEWNEFENTNKTSPWNLFNWNNFDEFLNESHNYITNSPTWVNSTLFFLIDNNEIIWAIDIRHNINHPVLNETWWHIWYWIVPKFRKQWYASKMLELWLMEAKNLWIDKVLLICNINNIASNKIIQKNWWIFERKSQDWKMNRYWIKL